MNYLIIYFIIIIALNQFQTMTNAKINSCKGLEGKNYYECVLKNLNNLKTVEVDKCQPEVFIHDYILKGNRTKSHLNQWRQTYATQSATLRDLCIDSKGIAPIRKCLHINKTAVWEPIDNWSRVQCLSGDDGETVRLNQILNTLIDVPETTKNSTECHELAHEVRVILESPKVEKTPTNIDITTKILTKLTKETADEAISADILGIYKVIHESPRSVLRIASRNHNATNEFVKTIDNYMNRLTENNLTTRIKNSHNKNNNNSMDHSNSTQDYADLCTRSILSKYFSTFLINPDCANVSGICIYDSKVVENKTTHLDGVFGDFAFRYVYANESAELLMKEPGIQAATFLPQNVWNEVKLKMKNNELWIVIKIIVNDNLFLENADIYNAKPKSKVILITIPGFEGVFETPMPFILRNNEYQMCSVKPIKAGSGCGYWDMASNISTWVSNGVETKFSGSYQQPLVLCQTKHLTPFSYLTHGAYRENDLGDIIELSENDQLALDLISLVGCSLSLLGMLGIWLTALISPAWRTAAKTKVLLNVCVALTLQMLLFICMNIHQLWEDFFDNLACLKCIILGAIMQYTTLVLFCWMLIVAILQYKRYVRVFYGGRPRRYILKSALFAWGLPIVPTALVLFIDSDSYTSQIGKFVSGDGMCYPSGYGLLFGVLLPISLICFVNLFIFIYIFYSISSTLNQSAAKRDKELFVEQIRLSILLFFLLGLSWIFGIVSFFEINICFSYLFCLTATLQGFMFFLFFVLLEKQPRDAWQKLFYRKRSYQKRKKLSDTQAVLTNSSAAFLSNNKRCMENNF